MKRLARVLAVLGFAAAVTLVGILADLAAIAVLALVLSLFLPTLAAFLISLVVVGLYRGVRLAMRGEVR